MIADVHPSTETVAAAERPARSIARIPTAMEFGGEDYLVAPALQAIGERLRLPVKSIDAKEAEAHFGWLAPFISRDAPASSALTRKRLSWQPKERGLLADLRELQLLDR